MHYGCQSLLGTKMAISVRALVIELGLSPQPFQASYVRYKDWVTWSWMMSIWEKCSLYNVRIDILDIELTFPRERDCWLMQRFLEYGYSAAQLVALNRVRVHQQVVFLSCVLNAPGSDLDARYLRRRPDGQNWSELISPRRNRHELILFCGERHGAAYSTGWYTGAARSMSAQRIQDLGLEGVS